MRYRLSMGIFSAYYAYSSQLTIELSTLKRLTNTLEYIYWLHEESSLFANTLALKLQL